MVDFEKKYSQIVEESKKISCGESKDNNLLKINQDFVFNQKYEVEYSHKTSIIQSL